MIAEAVWSLVMAGAALLLFSLVRTYGDDCHRRAAAVTTWVRMRYQTEQAERFLRRANWDWWAADLCRQDGCRHRPPVDDLMRLADEVREDEA